MVVWWRAVWEIDELAKDCSSEVTEERELINDDRLAWKQWSNRAGRHLGDGQEYSAFQVFGAPKKNKRLWSCHGRTHTHTAEKVVPSNMCSVVGRKRLERRTPGASVRTLSLGILAWRETGPRCRPRYMRCDIDGFFHLRHTRLDPNASRETTWNGPDVTDQDGASFLSFPSWWPFALTDCRGGRPTLPDLGFATRSSVPAIL
jgi:hypothetical protein